MNRRILPIDDEIKIRKPAASRSVSSWDDRHFELPTRPSSSQRDEQQREQRRRTKNRNLTTENYSYATRDGAFATTSAWTSFANVLPIIMLGALIALYALWEGQRKFYLHDVTSKQDRENQVAYFKDSKLTSSPSVLILDDGALKVDKLVFSGGSFTIDGERLGGKRNFSLSTPNNAVCCLDDTGRHLTFDEAVTCNDGVLSCAEIKTDELTIKNIAADLSSFDLDEALTSGMGFLTVNLTTNAVRSVPLLDDPSAAVVAPSKSGASKRKLDARENTVITYRNGKLYLSSQSGNVYVDDPLEPLSRDVPHLVQFDRSKNKLAVAYLRSARDVLENSAGVAIPKYTLGVDESNEIVYYESLTDENLNKILPPLPATDSSEYFLLSALSDDPNDSKKLTWLSSKNLTKNVDGLTRDLLDDEKESDSSSPPPPGSAKKKSLVLYDPANEKFVSLKPPSSSSAGAFSDVKYFLTLSDDRYAFEAVSCLEYDERADYSAGHFALVDGDVRNKIKVAPVTMNLSGGNVGDVLTLTRENTLELRPPPNASATDSDFSFSPSLSKNADLVLVTLEGKKLKPVAIEEEASGEKVDYLLGLTAKKELKRIKNELDFDDNIWSDFLASKPGPGENVTLFYDGHARKIVTGFRLSDDVFNLPKMSTGDDARDNLFCLGTNERDELTWTNVARLVKEIFDRRIFHPDASILAPPRADMPVLLYSRENKKFVAHDSFRIPPLPPADDVEDKSFLLEYAHDRFGWVETERLLSSVSTGDQIVNIDSTKIVSSGALPTHLLCIQEIDEAEKIVPDPDSDSDDATKAPPPQSASAIREERISKIGFRTLSSFFYQHYENDKYSLVLYNESKLRVECLNVELPKKPEDEKQFFFIFEPYRRRIVFKDKTDVFRDAVAEYFWIFADLLTEEQKPPSPSSRQSDALVVFDKKKRSLTLRWFPDGSPANDFGLVGWSNGSLEFVSMKDDADEVSSSHVSSSGNLKLLGLDKTTFKIFSTDKTFERALHLLSDLIPKKISARKEDRKKEDEKKEDDKKEDEKKEDEKKEDEKKDEKIAVKNCLVTFDEETGKLRAHEDYQLPVPPKETSFLIYDAETKTLEWKATLPNKIDSLDTLGASAAATLQHDSVYKYDARTKTCDWESVENVLPVSTLIKVNSSNLAKFSYAEKSKETDESNVLYFHKHPVRGKRYVTVTFRGYYETLYENVNLKLIFVANDLNCSEKIIFPDATKGCHLCSGVVHLDVSHASPPRDHVKFVIYANAMYDAATTTATPPPFGPLIKTISITNDPVNDPAFQFSFLYFT